ncbi:alpha/beta hydrolase family protein [Nocardiopsis changdeensis]|uniref:alpha/beta hydrolase family protein n=1 Tax=Nocardiopsis changdeensis TaxID=2831969 RepID=UPI003F478199
MKSIKIKQSSYAGEVFLPSTSNISGSCIFLPGFPYSLGKNSAISFMVSLGYAVIFPQPPGTYDSDGSYTPQNHVDLIGKVIEDAVHGRLAHAKTQHQLAPLPRPRGLISHSFGTVAAASYIQVDNLDWAILFAPILGYSPEEPSHGVCEDLAAQISYVQRARSFTFRLGDVQEIIDQSWRLDDQKNIAFKDCATLIIGIVGEADDSTFYVDTLKENWDQLIVDRFGRSASSSLMVVPEAGHSISALLVPQVQSAITNLVEEGNLGE